MHILEPDYRFDSQQSTIAALDNVIKSFKDRIEPGSWYDGGWLIEDAEMIYGLGYISLQCYINRSEKDFCYATGVSSRDILKTGRLINNYNNTNIELINTLANYAKHGHDKIKSNTRDMLIAFGLRPNGDCDVDWDCEIDESPIYKGLNILSEKGDLMTIFLEVKEWRDSLWLNFHKMQKNKND